MTSYFVSIGKHWTREDGMCAMEWVSYLAGEPHSDSPACVCPTLMRFCVGFNDGLPDDERQKLRPYLARTIGTRGDGLAEHRAWLATDWLIRTHTPTWLALAGLDDAASRLRSLPPVLTSESLTRAMEGLRSVRNETTAARDAAGAAARGLAGNAVSAAAGAAAGDVVWAAVSRLAAVVLAAAADPEAWATLQPGVAELRRSAFNLLDRMLPTEPIRPPVAEDAERVCSLA